MNYVEVNKMIMDTFGRMPLVNSVTNDSLTWNIHKDIKYPAVAADLQNVTVTDGVASYNYNFTAGMIGVESEADRTENYSRMMQILYQGLEHIRDNNDVEINNPYVFQFGSLKFMDVLDCATCQVTIEADVDDDCELQAELTDEE